MVRRDLAAMERRQRWAGAGGSIVLGLSLALGLWVAGYLVQVTRTFPRGPFRQPSRLYGRATVLAVDWPASAGEIAKELEEPGYREAAALGLLFRGSFRRDGSRLAVGLRAFPDRNRGSLLGVAACRPRTERRTRGPIAVDGQPAQSSTSSRPPGQLCGEDNEERRPVTLDELPEYVSQAVLAAEDDALLHPSRGLPHRHRPRPVDQPPGRRAAAGRQHDHPAARQERLPDEQADAGAQGQGGPDRHDGRAALRQGRDPGGLPQRDLPGPRAARPTCIGLGAASRAYFGKHAAELTLAEAADPGRHDPVAGRLLAHSSTRTRRVERRDWVLQRMGELGWARAGAGPRRPRPRPLRVHPRDRRRRVRSPPTSPTLAEREAEERFGVEELGGQGYLLFATLRWRDQRQAEAAVARGLGGLEKGWERGNAQQGPLQAALVSVDPARRLDPRLGGRARLRAEPVRPGRAGAPAGGQRLQAGRLRRGLRGGGGDPGHADQGLADQRPRGAGLEARRTTTAASAAG